MSEARVVLKAYNELRTPLKQAQGDLTSFGQVAEKVGATLSKAFKITTIVVAIKKLGDGLTDCFKEFSEAERKYKQLSIALGDTKSFDAVTKKIKELSKITLSSKDSIESMASELAGLGYSADQVNKISEAAVHLSNITGQDLSTSMKTLQNSLNGNVKALNKLGIDTSRLTKQELKNGAAVDLVIKKYGELSKAMAEADNSQHIANIKNNLGDIKQSIGDIISFSIAPLLAKIEVASEKAVEAFQNFADRAKEFISNFGQIWERFVETLKASLKNLFSIEGITTLVNALFDYIIAKIKMLGTAIANIGTLVYTILEEVIKGLGNYAMYWVTHIADELGINISEVVNSIGQWLLDSPIGQFVDNIVSKAVNGVRLVLATIKNIPEILKIIFSHLGDLVKEFFSALPSALANLGKAILERAKFIVQKIKNDFLQAIEDLINNLVNSLPGWLKNILGIDGKTVDFNINRDKEREAYFNSQNAMTKVGESFTGLKEVGKDIGEQITKLMNPTFDKFVADNSTTIGQKLATWSTKASEEYYEAAQKNFSNIGDFIQDWGRNFIGDLGDNWDEVKGALEGIFTDEFKGNWAEFTKYLKKVTTPQAKQQTSGTGTGTGVGSEATGNFLTDFANNMGQKLEGVFGATAGQISSGIGSLISDLTSQLGEAGDLINRLATNIATMGPVIGAIVTALHYVIEGFAEIVNGPLNDNIKAILEPLRELGRILGEATLPLFQMLQPFLDRIAQTTIRLFTSLGEVLKPIIEVMNAALLPILDIITNAFEALAPVIKVLAKVLTVVTGTIQWIIQTLMHWIASFLNWLAGLNIFGWQPLSFLRVTDPGSPGSYGDFIGAKLSAIDAAYERTYSTGSDVSTTQAVTNASYSGATTVHLNVYNYGNITGDNGIMEFALLIRDTLVSADYLGR